MINQIIKSDVIDGLKALEDNSIDIIISDPPYNIGKDFGECKDKMEMDAYLDWCKLWIDESMRVLKPTGTFYIYGFSEILAHIFVKADSAEFKRWLVWHYTNKNSAGAKFWQRSHESIILLAKQKPTFNEDLVREPYTDSFLKGSVGRKRPATAGRFSTGQTETVYTAHDAGALPRDVLKQPTLAGSVGSKERANWCKTCNTLVLGKEKKEHNGHDIISHPTQKPLALTRRLIAAAKNTTGISNAVILFSGTGAEAVAAQQEGCDFIGFDINDDYILMANEWLKRDKQ